MQLHLPFASLDRPATCTSSRSPTCPLVRDRRSVRRCSAGPCCTRHPRRRCTNWRLSGSPGPEHTTGTERFHPATVTPSPARATWIKSETTTVTERRARRTTTRSTGPRSYTVEVARLATPTLWLTRSPIAHRTVSRLQPSSEPRARHGGAVMSRPTIAALLLATAVSIAGASIAFAKSIQNAGALGSAMQVLDSRDAPARVPQQTSSVSFVVIGLPSTVTPHLFIDEPAAGGGFIRVRPAADQLTGSVTLAPGQFLEAALLPVGDAERYAPTQRFQSAVTGTLTFVYERQFLVLVSRWSHGGQITTSFASPGGVTSSESSWATAGSTFTVAATPNSGFTFSDWGVFSIVDGKEQQRASSRVALLRVVVDRPLHLVAKFVAE
jgi:List-Bact-rpt repeat protein